MTAPRRKPEKVSFTEYRALETEAGRIGLLTCCLCGATVLLGDPEPWPEVHAKWHERVRAKPKGKRP